VSAPHQEFA